MCFLKSKISILKLKSNHLIFVHESIQKLRNFSLILSWRIIDKLKKITADTKTEEETCLTRQMSHGGNLVERESRKRRWCLLASLLAAWTSTSHLAHRAASSAQHMSVAGAFSHTSHCIFILLSSLSQNHQMETKTWDQS